MKKELKDREDVYVLVTAFYKKIRKDNVLGPIFNKHIKDWPAHLNLLTDFWETNLFFVKKFKGDPLQKHMKVDAGEHYGINEYHFGIWLNLWFQTIDELFYGEKANTAKNRARKMSTFIYLKIFKNRPVSKAEFSRK